MAGSLVLRLGLLAVLASKAWASCAYGTLLHPRAEEGTVDVNIFGYTGEIGPTKWVALSAENALCSTGTNQSPIDMVDGAFTIIPAAELSLSIPDMPEGTEFENLGTTVEVVAGEGTMAFGGVTYTLQQFHFHLPSEHLDNGTSMAMEMHMVWEGAAGEIAVIGAFIDIEDGAGGEAGAAPNATAPAAPVHRRRDGFLKMLRKKSVKKTQEKRQLPSIQGHFFLVNTPSTSVVTASTLLETVLGSVEEISEPGTVTKTQPLIMSELVNTLAAGSFQTHNGSLTTPPCSEGVRWLVSDQKLSIQTATFSKTRTVIGFNSRFPQGALGEPNVLQQ
ncbi:alpha carbonic anhydrase [Fusarium solani]|uniref:carbonic anhydrase n=1 Tax=Fusarium solani TaxID=169388 RepID=A0A9P9K506_FUSSL|nr:alpha carbonic anhydrase [Fusarium solani]KAH7248233.1 alpha carbonic anhydrase [Fusarium solani]